MLGMLLVNAGNYLYNVLLGRWLGPEAFADAALMITFLLVLSFLAMTFQLATAKFTVLFSGTVFARFHRQMYRYAIILGMVVGVLLVLFAQKLQVFFNTGTQAMFVVFGLGIPVYFAMSVNRGVYQGKQQFRPLTITYQTEMWSRLVFTFILLALISVKPSLWVAVGIVISFFFGFIPFKKPETVRETGSFENTVHTKEVWYFLAITAAYECTQILINNSDILMVKHFFPSMEAGLYASLALIGRMVYFVAWMFVMQLLPTVVQLKKDGKPYQPVLFKYMGYVSVLSASIVLGCLLFPETVISLMFGTSYITMAPLLWKYAIATSLFALSNVFVYYFLSISRYLPVLFSGLGGAAQILLIYFFHKDLEQVVHMQIWAMGVLFVVQVSIFMLDTVKNNPPKVSRQNK